MSLILPSFHLQSSCTIIFNCLRSFGYLYLVSKEREKVRDDYIDLYMLLKKKNQLKAETTPEARLVADPVLDLLVIFVTKINCKAGITLQVRCLLWTLFKCYTCHQSQVLFVSLVRRLEKK